MKNYDYNKDILSDLKELNKLIMENAKLEEKKVSDSDLKKMIEYMATIDEENSSARKHNAYYAGAIKIQIYDYDNNKKITLLESGDFSMVNTSENASDLTALILQNTRIRESK